MPRWLQIALTLVLFAAIMLAVKAVLVAVMPSFSTWLGETFGEVLATAGVFALIAGLGLYGLWPRDDAGRMRPLPRRR